MFFIGGSRRGTQLRPLVRTLQTGISHLSIVNHHIIAFDYSGRCFEFSGDGEPTVALDVGGVCDPVLFNGNSGNTGNNAWKNAAGGAVISLGKRGLNMSADLRCG